MKKLTLFLLLSLTSCTVSYNVITEDSLDKARKSMFDIMQDNNYTLVSKNISDTVLCIHYINQKVPHHWFIEDYTFTNQEDSLRLSMNYSVRYITEASMIPYIEDTVYHYCVSSSDISDICDNINLIFHNIKKSEVKVLSEDSILIPIILAFLTPFATIMGYAIFLQH